MTKGARGPLRVEHLLVRADRIEARIRIADGYPRYTDEALIERCLKDFPTIGMHACRNGQGPTFAAVMNNTSIPHLLEHLVIDLQVRADNDESRVFVGTTQWSVECDRVACVQVSFRDDLVALAAFKQALASINGYLEEIDSRRAGS